MTASDLAVSTAAGSGSPLITTLPQRRHLSGQLLANPVPKNVEHSTYSDHTTELDLLSAPVTALYHAIPTADVSLSSLATPSSKLPHCRSLLPGHPGPNKRGTRRWDGRCLPPPPQKAAWLGVSPASVNVSAPSQVHRRLYDNDSQSRDNIQMLAPSAPDPASDAAVGGVSAVSGYRCIKKLYFTHVFLISSWFPDEEIKHWLKRKPSIQRHDWILVSGSSAIVDWPVSVLFTELCLQYTTAAVLLMSLVWWGLAVWWHDYVRLSLKGSKWWP